MGRKHREPSALEPCGLPETLSRFDRSFEAGEMQSALEIAEAALRHNEGAASLHHAHGLALWGMGRHQLAAEAMLRAIELDPQEADSHLDLATLRMDHLGQPAAALQGLKQLTRPAGRTPELQASLHVLQGRAWSLLEEPRTAEKELRRAVKLLPEDGDLRTELAEMQLDRADLTGARRTLEDALKLDPGVAQAHWLQAVLLDRSGDPGARKEFEEASRLDAQEFFVPERLEEAEFDRHVEKALAGVPPRFRRHLSNTEIAVEPYPSDAFLRDHAVSPLLLGMFLGTPMTLRGFEGEDLPARVMVFQRNLENICRTRRELVHEIGITLRHEIGHFLGMEEEDLEDAGHA